MKLAILVCIIFCFGSTVVGQGLKPDKGFVPDSNTAVRIAEAVLIPVYGEKKIEAERPFKAEFEDGVWTVNGTLRCPDGHGGTTTNCVGGTATVKIAKADGRIIFMIHYK
jgi:hypothetical protein